MGDIRNYEIETFGAIAILGDKLLFENGVVVNSVISPAFPPGRKLLRTSYMATHTEEQLDKVLTAFEKVGRQTGVI